ncbi:valyl-tRNA synthetase, putative [Trypanosoma brucei brucei TREU927]|uniref:Valine--tRNA ligase, mitochondrial n=1 Tax=Trypanosoma brucei brucei (strain 927/4 GUTat10.1) TaxID=185431 RepID=Q587B4_TRYB2|nr:valyl-tRNA synthetase, putative [Trypanosoma brucei brucei TREU927]AAX79263.1 valyl-tRNA synthetase, putative [Trypanosoma brucei]AAZ12006.1 valyl-tRNA synthetase, putative [Trypanosoma brucei brucei TREU927]
MKQLAPQMAPAYIPKDVESGWYEWWEESGFFRPASDMGRPIRGRSFVIVSPPPNVTGHLHIGHALTGAVQDALIRFHRMKGDDTLYLPGTDHAGIATQVVVEKRLMKESGKSRHDVGREEFLKQVWVFKENHCGVITRQLRRIGLSLDWSRERFTMDEQCAKAVVEGFVKLHEDGLIYRATRLINWCCSLQSAISDLEVVFEDVPKNAKLTIPGYDRKVDMGVLTHVAYKFADSEDEIIIATTRPETILGDTAVAVHPDDERYKKYHGKRLKCPFRDETIPLILDPVLVDVNFGTGAVKITPAHDPNDFEAGLRHNLSQLTMMDLKGHVTTEGPFKGMHRFDCRREIVKELEKMGLLREVVPYEYRVGRCSRTGDIVEPLLMPQWFVDCTEMARKSVEAVRNNELRLYPPTHQVVWYHWLENIKPWCVSRQLWWGHRIPAYKCTGAVPSTHEDPWVVARNLEEAKAKAKEKFNLSDAEVRELVLEQDSDVLDTWFSSAMWPFSTMGWPAETGDMQRFFPGSLMETGHDILFFWVARMVMTSLHFTGKLPFSEVFLHAMVRDKNGEKMSKSKGNVIDPLFIISGVSLEALHDTVRSGNLDEKEVSRALKLQRETFPNGIPECGSDALRFGLLSYTQSGRNVNLDIDRVVAYRQLCNKLWNAVRFVLYHALGEDYKPKATLVNSQKVASLPLECRWILSRLDVAVEECTRGFSEGTYDFALATNAVYRFWLYELCDVYLELTKPTIQAGGEKKVIVQDVLLHVVEVALRLLHPMMPFLTEELWHYLPNYESFGVQSIVVAPYPEVSGWQDSQVEEQMKLLMETVHIVRSTKAFYSLTNKHKPDVWVTARAAETREIVESHKFMIESLGVVGRVSVIPPEEEAAAVPKGCGFAVVNKDLSINMMLLGFIDVQKEVAKLEKQLAGLQKQIEGVNKKISMPGYETKVPADVREANKVKLESLVEQEAQLTEGLTKMKSLL